MKKLPCTVWSVRTFLLTDKEEAVQFFWKMVFGIFLDNHLFNYSNENLVTNLSERKKIDFCCVQINCDISNFWLLITLCNMPKGLVTQLQSKQQACIHLLYESLVGKCEYTTKPKGSFWCHVVDTNSAVLLLIFTN